MFSLIINLINYKMAAAAVLPARHDVEASVNYLDLSGVTNNNPLEFETEEKK
jgi:hypothetical protein